MNKITITEEIVMNTAEKEVFRMLRTNLEFTGIDNKVIALTSFNKNTGKTTVAFSLANVIAESGKKVLFIDADIRNSVLAYRLQYEQEPKGLSHLLSGQSELSEVIYQTNYNRLFLLPSGIFPKNPTELLGHERFASMIEAVRKLFDYVIVDTAPVGTVIDAAVVAKVCDGTILVIEQNKVSRSDAVAMADQIRRANPNILGVVMNKVKTKGTGHYGYGYGRYGSYGSYGHYGHYGHGSNESEEEVAE